MIHLIAATIFIIAAVFFWLQENMWVALVALLACLSQAVMFVLARRKEVNGTN